MISRTFEKDLKNFRKVLEGLKVWIQIFILCSRSIRGSKIQNYFGFILLTSYSKITIFLERISLIFLRAYLKHHPIKSKKYRFKNKNFLGKAL